MHRHNYERSREHLIQIVNGQKAPSMNLRYLAEVAVTATWVDAEAPRPPLSARQLSHISEYWKYSSVLFRLWNRQLESCGVGTGSPSALAELTREVIVSELLTRCVAGKLFVMTESIGSPNLTRIARRSLMEQALIRNACLDHLAESSHLVSEELQSARLQRKIDRWSDLLLSRLVSSDAALEACVDIDRCLDFASDTSLSTEEPNGLLALQLQTAAMRRAIPNEPVLNPVNRETHQRRCEAAMAMHGCTSSPVGHLPNSGIQRMISQVYFTDTKLPLNYRPMNQD